MSLTKRIFGISLIASFAILLSAEFTQAQKKDIRGYRTRNYTKFHEDSWWELVVSAGITNFLGDVGGSPDIGTNFAKDLNFRASRPVFQLGLKRFYHPRFAQKLTLSYGWVNGDDFFTSQPERNYRNLNFRSPVVELMTQFEVYLIKETKPQSRYNLAGIKTKRTNPIELYLFAGIGGYYFNPKGLMPGGTWIPLRPLNTEGQGAIPGRKPYGSFALCIPLGFGFTFKISEKMKIGIEAGLRKTTTDYMDDVSTTYVGDDILANTPTVNSLTSAIMADKSKGHGTGQTAPGEQRGDPRDKDSYMFFTLGVHYKFNSFGKSKSPRFW